jgi:hypothetical protein
MINRQTDIYAHTHTKAAKITIHERQEKRQKRPKNKKNAAQYSNLKKRERERKRQQYNIRQRKIQLLH